MNVPMSHKTSVFNKCVYFSPVNLSLPVCQTQPGPPRGFKKMVSSPTSQIQELTFLIVTAQLMGHSIKQKQTKRP